MCGNINNFSKESINIAISNNYIVKKYADVICTEASDGFLTMIPANQISLWAEIEGEIRPAGRNHYHVWTPNALKRFLIEKYAIISKNKVIISKNQLDVRVEREGNGRISRYKINPLFFVYVEDCKISDDTISFELNKVRQLNPTIAGKMFFGSLKHSDVKKYYEL